MLNSRYDGTFCTICFAASVLQRRTVVSADVTARQVCSTQIRQFCLVRSADTTADTTVLACSSWMHYKPRQSYLHTTTQKRRKYGNFCRYDVLALFCCIFCRYDISFLSNNFRFFNHLTIKLGGIV